MTHFKVRPGLSSRWFAAPILACFAALGCGGEFIPGAGPGPDSGVPDSSDGGTRTACGADEACPSGSTCFFPIGSCGAKGQCFENPSPGTPVCNAIELLCGCDGTSVTSGCGFPDGYASAPTAGGGECDGGGKPPNPPDSGVDSAVDSGVDSGTDRGPCGANGACPSGSSCYFPIGSCDATGECIENPPPGAPECNAVELLCGCDGQEVTGGCGYPAGYASAPTNGTGACALDAGPPVPKDAAPPEDSGTDRGPCDAKGGCPSGSSCYFPIGSCDATGECISNPDPGTPECGAIELLCGCNGKQVTTGCGYPMGYASGPTTGSNPTTGGDCLIMPDP
jgi:hypothetical protein